MEVYNVKKCPARYAVQLTIHPHYSFFKNKAIRYNLSSSSRCINCFLNTKLNTSISILKGLFKSIIINISLLIILYLI